MKILLKKITLSEQETLKFGEEIIKIIPKGINLIILKGSLGSGKTVLVKGIAKSLKIKDTIVSPTFGYKKQYSKLTHYDLYLIKKIKKKELMSLISEDLENNLVIIEWGDKLPKIKNSILIEIKLISEFKRLIELKLI